ncbi:MAG TPA: hypothetical protein VGO61_06985 [Steroidobacteraceae bacterium]|nr:hypothetical protein [Steroidobacteraceae bacterium]
MSARASNGVTLADRSKYEREIETRQLRIEEVEGDIDEFEERLADARAAAIVGDGPSSLVTELQAKIEKANTFVRDTLAEVKALRSRMEALEVKQSAEQKQNTIETTVLPAVAEMAAAAHRVDALACQLGQAIREMIEPSVRAGNAWPLVSTGVLTRFVDRRDLAALVWAKICANSNDALPYESPAAEGGSAAVILNIRGRDLLGGPITWTEPMIPRTYVAMWHAFVRNETGRDDLANEILSKIEGGTAGAKKRAKVAA